MFYSTYSRIGYYTDPIKSNVNKRLHFTLQSHLKRLDNL